MKAKYYCLDSSRSLVRLLLANITYFFSHVLNNVFLLHLHNLAIAYSPITPDCLERKPSILNSACCAVMKHMQPVYLVVTCFLDISSTPEKKHEGVSCWDLPFVLLWWITGRSGCWWCIHQPVKAYKEMGNFRFDTAFIFLFSSIVSASEEAAFHGLEIKKANE